MRGHWKNDSLPFDILRNDNDNENDNNNQRNIMSERKMIYLCLAHMSDEGYEQK